MGVELVPIFFLNPGSGAIYSDCHPLYKSMEIFPLMCDFPLLCGSCVHGLCMNCMERLKHN